MSEIISQMTSGNPAQNGDLIPIARSGANFNVTLESVAALAAGPSLATKSHDPRWRSDAIVGVKEHHAI